MEISLFSETRESETALSPVCLDCNSPLHMDVRSSLLAAAQKTRRCDAEVIRATQYCGPRTIASVQMNEKWGRGSLRESRFSSRRQCEGMERP